jgi:hypothetical protein
MKRQQPWILAAAIGAVALGVTACSKPAEDTTTPTTTSSGKVDDSPRTVAAPGAPGMPPGMPGMPGGPFASGGQGGIFGNTPAAATPANAAKKPLPAYTGPLPGKGRDPFLVTWAGPKPQPPVFATVQPIRLASANITAPPPPNTEIREVPFRRVSGILSGDGVYAILEGGGEPEIVKPGSRTSDGYRVVSITSDSVKLQKRQGNVTLTQVVPLSDTQVSGPRTAAFGGQGGYRGGQFRGGVPGAFPGGLGGFPGGPGGLPGVPGGLPGGEE